MIKRTQTDLMQIHASTKNYDPENKIRLGTDLRFVNSARPWDQVSFSFASYK